MLEIVGIVWGLKWSKSPQVMNNMLKFASIDLEARELGLQRDSRI